MASTPAPTAIGISRRLQALVAMGHDPLSLARDLDLTMVEVAAILDDSHRPVESIDTGPVLELFSRLWAVAPSGQNAERARAVAALRHWHSPLAWDDIDDPAEVANTTGPPDAPSRRDSIDPIAVELSIRGLPQRLTTAERELLVRRLHALRWSDGRVHEVTGINERTVMRIRNRLGLDAFPQHELQQKEVA